MWHHHLVSLCCMLYKQPGSMWGSQMSFCVLQAGHAVAAAAEGVGVQHVGAFTLLLLPGAYVAMDSGALATLGPWRTLRVCPPSCVALYVCLAFHHS